MINFLSLQPVDDILTLLDDFKPLPGENIPLDHCLGRVLAAPFAAPENLPGFVRSTMDGYAVRARDVFGASEQMPALLTVRGECQVGAASGLRLEPGQSARIWTGAMLPDGADAVVMLEYTRPAGSEEVELTRPVGVGENVIAADEDARAGEELLPAGRRLRPQEIGLLAALGQSLVMVRQRPKVAIISSGDEIVPLSARPQPGQVRDINAHALAALVRASGGRGRFFGIAGDDQEQLKAKAERALAWADVLLLSGGSSAGQRDFTLKAFQALPGVEILAHGVAISPGKPLIMARRGGQSLWGLPGHAASALICAEVFIRPLLRRLLGLEDDKNRAAGGRARLSRPVASAQGRRDYIRVRLTPPPHAGEPWNAAPVMGKSGLITTLVLADALIICPEELEGLSAGQMVELYPLL